MSFIHFNETQTFHLSNTSFDNLPYETVNQIFKDGRVFSHFIEKWLEQEYNDLKHVSGCKKYDFVDINNPEIKYDQKTFTKLGCKFMPSNMIGQGRTFNQEEFEEKTKKLMFIIVSNINFPEIKVKFMKGEDILKMYPNGKILSSKHNKFFN